MHAWDEPLNKLVPLQRSIDKHLPFPENLADEALQRLILFLWIIVFVVFLLGLGVVEVRQALMEGS